MAQAYSGVNTSVSDKNDTPNLYIMGFMGTGKSAVGRIMAKKLRRTYLDADAEIERMAGKTINQIFTEHGEAYFRNLEMQFIENGHPDNNCIVSCGGGMLTIPEAIEKLRRKGVIVSLFASAETIHARIKHNKHRPLLNVEDPLSRIRELLAERETLYQKAGINVTTDNRSLQEVANHVERIYKEAAANI